MPTLSWVGKDKVVNHHHDVPFRLLDKQYAFAASEGAPTNSTDNRIIHGDNLEALKSLLPEFEGKVNCIYIDPPYNTGNEGWVYNDNVNDPKIKKWLGEVVGKEGEDLSRHDKWLCMMYPRLKLLHRLLADDGVLLISIGDDELQNLILICNEIFGVSGHDATFVWKSRTKPTNAGNAKFRPQKVTEYVLMYSKNKKLLFNTLSGEDNYNYPFEDDDGKYRTTTILTSNLGSYERETMRFPIADYKPQPDQRWKAGEEVIQDLYDNNRLQFKDGVPMQKIYELDNESINKPLYTLIKQELSGTAEKGKTLLNKILKKGHAFDTVKPIELIEYLLEVVTSDGSIILDSFAGSGTTAHAVLKLGNNRKFILIETMPYAETITAERVRRVINGYGEGDRATPALGGGFDYYTVGEPIFLDADTLNEAVGIEAIRSYVAYSEGVPEADRVPQTNPYNPHLLGLNSETAWVFNYDPADATSLDMDFLKTLKFGKAKPALAIIYADRCLLSKSFMSKHSIIFKKIPRDITRF